MRRRSNDAGRRGGGISWRFVVGVAAFSVLAHTLTATLIHRQATAPSGDRPAGLVDLAKTIAAASAVTSLFVVFLARRRWTRPLLGMVRTARALGRGDVSVRTPPAAGALGKLGRSLDRIRARLARNAQAIDRQRRMFNSLLTQLGEGVVVADADGRIVLINPAAVRLLNLPPEPRPEAIVGMAVERCIPQHDLQQMLLAPMSPPAEDASGGAAPAEAQGARAWRERVHVEAAEGVTHLLVHASDLLLPSPGERSEETMVRLLVLTDITALTRTIQVRTDFVANASHELRTPLSTIAAAVEALQQLDLARDARSAEKFVAIVDRQRKRLEALATDLLELARLESPASHFRPSLLALHDVLEDTRAEFAGRLAAKRIEWSADEDASVPVRANPELLRLVLNNLVDNAVKFTDPGGRVSIRVCADGDDVAVTVQDTGCGISPEDQERVFERFYQVERARSGQERGTGLGLSIVRHAVAAMGGEVRLESRPGEGTRVTFTIPRSPDAEPAHP